MMWWVRLSARKIPYISNVPGRWITTAKATDPEYWTRHLCRPVQFAEGLKQVCSPAPPVFLEVGPGQMLSGLAEQYLAGEGIADRVTRPSLPHSSDRPPDRAFFLQTLGNPALPGVVRTDDCGWGGAVGWRFAWPPICAKPLRLSSR